MRSSAMQMRNKSDLTLYIVDDDERTYRKLAGLLASLSYRLRVFDSGEAFLDQANVGGHGCVVLDMRMAGMNGLQVHDQLLQLKSPLKVLFLSGHGTIENAVASLNKGAVDWLVKKPPDETFIDKGEDIYKIIEKVDVAMKKAAEEAGFRALWEQLTDREKEVARLVRNGMRNQGIANLLGISVRTVESHRGRMYEQLFPGQEGKDKRNILELNRMMEACKLD